MKYEIEIGDLRSKESKTVEILVFPIASYAPGLEEVVLDMARHMHSLEGRDWSYAVNTGTGAFNGIALADTILASLQGGGDLYVKMMLATTGRVFSSHGWKASTRVLSNYILALTHYYDYTRNEDYLDEAEAAASRLLQTQIKNPSDPRDGGFLVRKHCVK
ncbi:MAG: hypothetical protein F7C35_07170 [Desulfurococcales archaeon]|nr:hypothetical protein [Desulfurococcales archaeon]